MIENEETTLDDLAEEKLNQLLSAVDTKKIISIDKAGTISLGGEKVDPIVLKNLKQEAEALLVSDLWKVLYHTPNELAQRAMFADEGTLSNLLLKGRAMIYLLDTQKKILETLSKVK
jgi:hypothetical protein